MELCTKSCHCAKKKIGFNGKFKVIFLIGIVRIYKIAR